MKIREININGFGKFNNRSFRFQPGLNLVYGENESGKSTISNYIYEIFFGGTAFGSNRAVYRKEFEKYKPWDSESFQGSMIFEYKNEDYIIDRRFLKGNEKLELLNLKTGQDSKDLFKINKTRKVEKLDEAFLGISENSLRNIYCIYDDSNSSKIDLDLQTRMMNQASTRSEDINLKDVFKNIDNYGDNTSIRKEIRLLNEQIKDKEKELGFIRQSNSYDKHISELDKIKKQIKTMEARPTTNLEDFELLNNKKNKILDKINYIEGKEERANTKLLTRLGIFSLFILLTYLYTKKTYLFSLIILGAVYYYLRKRENDKKAKETNKNLSILYSELDLIQEELNSFNSSTLGRDNQELYELKMERERLIERIKILDLNIEKEISLKEEIAKLKIKKDDLEFKTRMAKEAKNIIEELSSKSIKEDTINTMEIAGKYISYLTSNNYSQIYVQDNGDIRLYDYNKNRIVDLESLSRGTIDQVYLAYRLAMIDSVDVDFPIIIDDGFSFFDDRRNELALNLLEKISEKRQVLYFSSKLRDLEFFRKRGLSTIELGGKDDLGYR